MGWGPNELGGYHYWGGRKDYVEMLELDGHVVFVVSVGPVSSNWERAIEVYYQLKGGQVNYGRNHSEKHNIIQKSEGKSYEAIYPEWDENPPGTFNRPQYGGANSTYAELSINPGNI